MEYSKKQIGHALKKELSYGYHMERISDWAHDLYIFSPDISEEISSILRRIYMMDAGPEFEYTKEDLELLAEFLINEVEDPIRLLGNIKYKDIYKSYISDLLNDVSHAFSTEEIFKINSLLEADNWISAYEILCSLLLKYKILISSEYYEKCLQLGHAMGVDSGVWLSLKELIKP